MNATHVFRQMLPATLVALGLALGPAAMAAQNPNLPPEKSQGTVVYRSGGIGEDESMAMRKIAANYPLELEFVQKVPGGHQEYVADQDVVIKYHVGRTVLHTRVGGPFLLAAAGISITADTSKACYVCTRGADCKCGTILDKLGKCHCRKDLTQVT